MAGLNLLKGSLACLILTEVPAGGHASGGEQTDLVATKINGRGGHFSVVS